jgi:hypothetical protein
MDTFLLVVAVAGSVRASRFGVKDPNINADAFGSGHQRRRKEALATRRHTACTPWHNKRAAASSTRTRISWTTSWGNETAVAAAVVSWHVLFSKE